jgi:hypothetical protein
LNARSGSDVEARLQYSRRGPDEDSLFFDDSCRMLLLTSQRPQVLGERGTTERLPVSGCKFGAGCGQVEIDGGLRNDDCLSYFGAKPAGFVRFASIKIALDIPVKGAEYGA